VSYLPGYGFHHTVKLGPLPAGWATVYYTCGDGAGSDTPVLSVARPPPAGDAAQKAFFASELGQATLRAVEASAEPKLGESRVTFSSAYAAGLPAQLAALMRRTAIAYERNVGLNFGRLVALTMLNLLFGTIWFGIARDAADVSGVQSLVSCIFMGAAFGSMINMNQIVPSQLGVRDVFYREQASAMYSPTNYLVATILVETPWLAGILLVSTSVGYFMFGLVPAGFFFHYLVCLVLALVYVSLGLFVSFTVPTFEVAQAVLGLVGPLFFLFGGLWSPPPQMAVGARWFCYIDPITYAFKALIPQQFYPGSDGPGAGYVLLQGPTPPCRPGLPPSVPCGKGTVAGGAVLYKGTFNFGVDRYAYITDKCACGARPSILCITLLVASPCLTLPPCLPSASPSHSLAPLQTTCGSTSSGPTWATWPSSSPCSCSSRRTRSTARATSCARRGRRRRGAARSAE
jgi:hypothetical protein